MSTGPTNENHDRVTRPGGPGPGAPGPAAAGHVPPDHRTPGYAVPASEAPPGSGASGQRVGDPWMPGTTFAPPSGQPSPWRRRWPKLAALLGLVALLIGAAVLVRSVMGFMEDIDRLESSPRATAGSPASFTLEGGSQVHGWRRGPETATGKCVLDGDEDEDLEAFPVNPTQTLTLGDARWEESAGFDIPQDGRYVLTCDGELAATLLPPKAISPVAATIGGAFVGAGLSALGLAALAAALVGWLLARRKGAPTLPSGPTPGPGTPPAAA